MLNELEQKIRKAIPELNELGVGCFISVKEKEDKILQLATFNYPQTDIAICDMKYSIIDYDDAWGSSNTLTYKETIGKPIQLNHVLEYVKEYSGVPNLDTNRILKLWNLKSNLLSEQNEELIKFINEL